MDLIPFLFVIALQGLVIGALARLALPGRDPMSLLETMAVGLTGSLAAGLVVYLFTDRREAPSAFAGFLFAVLVVYVVRRRRGGSLSRAAGEPDSR